MNHDYSTITELPDSQVIPVQVERAYSRYRFAVDFCPAKDVLEVACGGGQGLGLLAANAKYVVGGDFESKNLTYARQTYAKKPNVQVIQLDAHHLPFLDTSFDLILIYEAIYYLKNPNQFLEECSRVLRPGGVLIICTANKDWPDFNPSPFSHRYFSVPELHELLGSHGFSSIFYGAFPDFTHSTLDHVKSFIKKIAVKMHLMPKTMKGKVLLKRLFFGGLVQMPKEFKNGQTPYTAPVSIPSQMPDLVHTAIYAVAHKQ